MPTRTKADRVDKEYEKAMKPAEPNPKQQEPIVSESDAPSEAHEPMPPKEVAGIVREPREPREGDAERGAGSMGAGPMGTGPGEPGRSDDYYEPKDQGYDEDGSKKKVEKLNKEQRIEILKKFTKEMLKAYGPLIRSIVLFGSTARQEFKGESDIDVFIIVDDTRHRITPSLKMKLEDDMERIAKSCHPLLSVQQPYMLTEFWNMVRLGHPIIFNFIREGVPVYDKDIFLPIKRLLQMGEIRPSKEAVEKFIERGPKRIKRVENAKMYLIVEDLYYAMLESAQAVLMFLGKSPPRPEEAPVVLRKTLVEMKLVKEDLAKDLQDIIELRKKIEHKKLNSVTGAQLDSWIVKSRKFVKKMESMIVKIEVMKRESMIEKSYAIMNETALTLLKAMNKEPLRGARLSEVMKRELVETGMIDKKYLDVLVELEKMRGVVKKGRILDIDKQAIMLQREYVRRFIRDAGRVLRKNIQTEMPAGNENAE
jgi:predicted nucleotidyltransferase/uncharacterized protein (UPF0332 family)